MNHAIDNELMQEHLKAHHAEIAKIEWYMKVVQDKDLLHIMHQQSQMMYHHVDTMEKLLRGQSTNLPPLPIIVVPRN